MDDQTRRVRSLEKVPGDLLRLRGAGRGHGTGSVGRRPALGTVHGTARVPDLQRGQPGYKDAPGAGMEKVNLPADRYPGITGSGACRAKDLRNVPVCRSGPDRDLGMERGRTDDTQLHVPLSVHLHHRHCSGLCFGPEAVRYRIPGALYGASGRQCGGVPGRVPHHPCP